MKSEIEEAINNHTDSIVSGKYSPPEGPCPKCLENPKHFKLHERKKRNFRYICESLVYTVLSIYNAQINSPTFAQINSTVYLHHND